MATILTNIYQKYYVDLMETRDFRAIGRPLASPWTVLTVSVLYLIFIKYGTKWMESRKPFDLNKIIMGYNILQVILNTVIFIKAAYELYSYHIYNPNQKYNWMCTKVVSDNSYYGQMEFTHVYNYYQLKFLDLADTVFFVLRKKNNQVSHLHVYHHVVVMWCTMISVNWVPGGHFQFLGMLNLFVHSVMYSYYFITLYRPQMRYSIKIKKAVTIIQLIQFTLLVIHSGYPILTAMPCAAPQFLLYLSCSQNIYFLYLFSDFYYHAYIRKKKSIVTTPTITTNNTQNGNAKFTVTTHPIKYQHQNGNGFVTSEILINGEKKSL